MPDDAPDMDPLDDEEQLINKEADEDDFEESEDDEDEIAEEDEVDE